MSGKDQAQQPEERDCLPGSPSNGEPVFLVVGKLRKPHGLRGEMAMEVITDFPERFCPGVVVYAGKEHRLLKIRSCREHGKLLLIAFEGFDNRDTVGVWRNHLIYVNANDSPSLPEGDYYQHHIIGLQVVTDEGMELGILSQVLETGANDVYLIKSRSGSEVLLPAIDDVILSVDLEREEMLVHLLPGLLPGQD